VSEVVTELKEAIGHEGKDSISIAEEIGIQNGGSLAGQTDSTKHEGMEWNGVITAPTCQTQEDKFAVLMSDSLF